MNGARSLRMPVVMCIAILFSLCTSCGGGGAGPDPVPDPVTDPWEFPASSRFALTLLPDHPDYAAGDTVSVGLVLYNVAELFGAALAVNYPPGQLEARDVLENPAILAQDSVSGAHYLSVIEIDDDNAADPDTVSYGFTYLRGHSDAFTGSGMLVKFRFLASAPGRAVLTIDPGALDLVTSDGTPIDDFAMLAKDSVEITIR